MGGIKTRHRAGQIGRKSIGQAGSDQADVLIAIYRKSYARCRRCDVDGLRPGIVQVKLKSVADLFLQVDLQRVVAGTSDRAPSVHGNGLVVQVITDPSPKRMSQGPCS